MRPLLEYVLPVIGLGTGLHVYKFAVNESFFRHFEGSPIGESDISLVVEVDKRPDLIVLDFHFSGTVRTACDRCLATINLPVSGSGQVLVKYAEEEKEDDEVKYITRYTQELDLSQYAYEFICLSLPIIRTYNCTDDPNPPCDQEVLKRIAAATEEQPEGSPWEGLKDMKFDAN